MTSRDRTRRRATATAHTQGQDDRREPTSGIKADARRKVLREQRKAARPAPVIHDRVTLLPRVPLHSAKFNRQHPAALAFHAPQRQRASA